MKGFENILGDMSAPYNFKLDLKGGEIYQGRPPYPILKVLESSNTFVREIRFQTLKVRARSHESAPSEDVLVMRLVAVLEDDSEIEMSRTAVNSEVFETQDVDRSKCASCGKKIPVGAEIIHDGMAYHRGTCFEE